MQEMKALRSRKLLPSTTPLRLANFPEELYTAIAYHLDTKDLVKAIGTCKGWKDRLDWNHTLWNGVLIDRTRMNLRNLKIAAELVKNKSLLGLKKVVIANLDIRVNGIPALKKWLDKSTVEVVNFGSDEVELRIGLAGLLGSKLFKEFKVATSTSFREIGLVKLVDTSTTGKTLEIQSFVGLCQPHFKVPINHRPVLSNLSVLVVSMPMSRGIWKEVLRVVASSIKYLNLSFTRDSHHPRRVDDDDLVLAALQVLWIDWDRGEFPNWLKIPSTSTLILSNFFIPANLPSVKKLIAANHAGAEHLVDSCPGLTHLISYSTARDRSTKNSPDNLLSVILKRKENVREGMEVEGVPMVDIKSVAIHFKGWSAVRLAKLLPNVEELVDLDLESTMVEVCVEV